MDNQQIISQLKEYDKIHSFINKKKEEIDQNGKSAREKVWDITYESQNSIKDSIPKFPELWKDKIPEETGNIASFLFLGIFILIAIAIIIAVIKYFAETGFIGLIIIAVIVGGAFLYIKKTRGSVFNKTTKDNAESRIADSKNESKKLISFSPYKDKWCEKGLNYEKERNEFLDDCVDFDNSFLKSYVFFEKSINELVLSQNRIVNGYLKEIEKAKAELDSITVIDDEYGHLANRIANILEKGRSDNFQDALNLAIEEDRKEREERERQNEAMRQEKVLHQQAEENRLHNLKLENLARQQEKRIEELQRQIDRQRYNSSH